MSFVGIPQACESIAIDLEVLSSKLRMYAQAMRRPDLNTPDAEKQARVLSKKARANLDEFLSMLPQEAEEKPKEKSKKNSREHK